MARVLVVDDDEQVLISVKRILERSGYEVDTACDGQEGLTRFQKGSFDLILLDLIMPEKEGIETIMELRRINPQTKIVAMSGGGRVGPLDYLRSAELLGAQASIAKPFEEAQLLCVVADALASQ